MSGKDQTSRDAGKDQKSQQQAATPGNAQRGGGGNFANDPQKASDAGRKGGEHSHGGNQKSQSGQQHASLSNSNQQNAGRKSGDK